MMLVLSLSRDYCLLEAISGVGPTDWRDAGHEIGWRATARTRLLGEEATEQRTDQRA